ncbi:hypothetical protein CEY16_01220 [Halalkalibacillus sediminis]|uniref:Uncharacterized protein n=1 Tax=Halalkalibacillus sediminis TaxID=2018042 RepID=A0A2I0QVQ1_9BACI|nr:hypothetical protein [Halalkalibacillus sediminis]PKR78406.1 hypothetical protein CEY16_01220 [Halalkalibacillus sediminis]
MKKYYIKHESKLMLMSRKNQLFTLFLLLTLLAYIFLLLPAEEHPESFNPAEMEQHLERVHAQQETRRDRGFTHMSPVRGTSYYAQREHYYLLHTKMLEAYETNNVERFSRLRLDYILNNPRAYFAENHTFSLSLYVGQDRLKQYNSTLLKYQSLINRDEPLRFSMIEEKTALQKLHELFSSPLTYLILFIALYISCDVLIRDRYNPSVTQGLPLSWYRTINLKCAIAFGWTLMLIMGLIVLGTILIGIRFGLGDLGMQIPIKTDLTTYNIDAYDYQALGFILLKSFTLMLIIVWLLTRLSAWISLWIRNTWGVLLISSVFLFSEWMYFERRTYELFGIHLKYFPQTYFDFGQIADHEKNFLMYTEVFTFKQALIVLLITVLAIEIMIAISAKWVTKRRFFQA